MSNLPILPPRWRSRGRRTRAELVGIAIAGAGWAIQLGLFFIPHGHGYAIAMTVWGIGFFVFVIGLIMCFKAPRRAATALLACGLRMCLNCRYRLPDQPDTGACPECGCRYSPEELATGWGATYPRLRRAWVPQRELTERDSKALIAMLRDPDGPNDALRGAAQRYRDRTPQ